MRDSLANNCPTCLESLETPTNLCNNNFKDMMDLLVYLLGCQINISDDEFYICRMCTEILKQILTHKDKFKESYIMKCCQSKANNFVEHTVEIEKLNNYTADSDLVSPPANISDSDSTDDNTVLIHFKNARTQGKSGTDNDNKLAFSNRNESTKHQTITRRITARIQQHPVKDVIDAIADATSYMTDMKNRVCLHCNFSSNLVKGLYHHMRKHKDLYPLWCARCNVQTDDLKKHQQLTKCSINQCKFCGRLNRNIYVLTEHLRCHSRAAFFVNDHNKDMDSDDIEDMQNELNEKPVTQIRKRGPYKKVKSYECEPSTSSHSDGECEVGKISTTKRKLNNFDEYNGWDNCDNDGDQSEGEFEGNLTPTRQNPYKAGIPLEQFPAEEVQRALTDAMRPFYNARRCPQCAFLTKNIAALQRHIQPCHKEIYNQWCNDCNNIVDNLKEHKKVHRADLLKCPFCGASRKSRDHLKKHLTNHCSSDRKLVHGTKWYSCVKCPCSYPEEADFTRHICTEDPPLRLYTYQAKDVKNEMSESVQQAIVELDIKGKYEKKILKKGWKNRRLFPFCVFCKKTVRSLQDHLVLKHGYEPTQSKNRPSKFDEPPRLGKEKDLPETATNDRQEYRGPKCTKFRFCNICKRNVRYIRDHMKRFHSDLPKRSYLCSACGKTFVSSTSLQAHTKFVHNTKPSEQPLKCSTCGKILGNLATLKVHEKLHVTKKSHACHLCGVCFIDNSQLRSHLKTHIGEDHGPVYCSVCNKKFLRPALLDLHMQKFHTGQDPYKCMICFKVLTRMGSLKQHMKYVHGEHEDLKCKYCGKELRSPGTLKKHELIHIGVKPYKCSVCSFSCRQSNGLTSHMKQHPEDLPQESCPHKCAFCYRRFNTKAMLTSHIALRHKNEQMMQKE